MFTNLNPATLRSALIEYGDPIVGYDYPAPRVNVAKVVYALKKGMQSMDLQEHSDSLQIKDVYEAINSVDDIEKGLALSNLVQHQLCPRDELWRFTLDKSPVIRKIAVYALGKPINNEERRVFWNRIIGEKEGGVRGWYAYGLLQDAEKKEVAKWISLSTDTNWTVRWCVSEYLAKFPDTFPKLEKTYDPDLIKSKALPIQEWLNINK